ncbi:MAG: ankyrin repeat domain-containing protein [Gammaproteobacteria bacterium]|nr:ankyrin repeat domain-containing protein [Gammaproteobacteria bacterium]
MPHSVRSLQSIYNYFISLDENEGVHTEILGKNQEVHTFHNEVLMGHGPFNIDKLRSGSANEFAALVGKLGLSMEDDIDKTAEGEKGYSALHFVISMNRLDLLIVLLDHGASPLVQDHEGNSAILLAAKFGRKEMLQEFCKMIEGGSKHASSSQANAESAEQKVATKAPVSKAEKHEKEAEPEVKTQHDAPKNGNKSRRLVLSPDDLKKANIHGETVFVVLEQTIQIKSDKAKKAYPLESHKANDLGGVFKSMVERLDHDSNAAKKDEQMAQEKPKEDKEVHKQYLHSNYMYGRLFREFDETFLEKRNEIVLKDAKEVEVHPELKAFVNKAKDETMSVVLPYDRSMIAGVLALLNDYSQFSLLHMGRRYRKNAAALVAPYLQEGEGKKNIGEVKDVIVLYEAISAELKNIQEAPHDDVKNTMYNSSYCRRLSFCLRQLQGTTIIRNYIAGNNHFNAVAYADLLKMTNHKLQIPM